MVTSAPEPAASLELLAVDRLLDKLLPIADSEPRRIQLRRIRGWRKPAGAIVVSRRTRWGNPFPVIGTDRAAAVERYRRWLPTSGLDLAPLRRHDLACWCPLDQPCHADVLLELANQ
jgi:hypothetical protein